MDVERSLLSKITEERDLKPALNAGITADFFEDDEARKVFQRMIELWTEHGQVPSAEALKLDFPTYRFVKPKDTYSFYVEEVRRAREYSLAHETIATAATVLKDDKRNPKAAINVLAEGLVNIYTEVSVTHDEDITETGEDRLERYKEIGLNTGLIGITTGFNMLDSLTSGLQPGQLITLVGEPKAGKSFTAMHMALAAHRVGHVPMLVSFEMSNHEQAMRHDAMRAGVSLTRLMHGKMTKDDEKKLRRMLHSLEGQHPFVMANSGGSLMTISSVAAKIEQHTPDVVIVDGVYLMQDEHGEKPNSPQALTNITREAKRIAQRREVPIVLVTQALTWKFSRKQGLTGDAIGYTSSFAQDSDLVVGIENTDDEEMKRLRVVLARNAPKRSWSLRWDWENMTQQEMDDEPDDEEDEEDRGEYKYE